MAGPSPSGGWVDHCKLKESPTKGVSLAPGIRISPRKGVRQTPGKCLADALKYYQLVLTLKVVMGLLLL